MNEISEAKTIEHLIGFTSLLLAGVSVFFTFVSAYVAALNYFVRKASLAARAGAFAFFTAALGMLMLIMVGARRTQWALVQDLQALKDRQGALSHTGQALLDNGLAEPNLLGMGKLPLDHVWRELLTVDGLVVISVWGTLGLTYLTLFLMTFIFRWSDLTAPVR